MTLAPEQKPETRPVPEGHVRLTIDGDGLRVDDPGIGLTPDDVREVVATAARRQCQNRHQGAPAPRLPALEAQKA